MQFYPAGLIAGLPPGRKERFALNTFLSVWEVFARSCKWISDLGNNMFVHLLGDWSVGVVQVQSGPAQL